MTIKVSCVCGRQLTVAAEKHGQRLRCPSCGERFVASQESADAKSVAEQGGQKKTGRKNATTLKIEQPTPEWNAAEAAGLPKTPKLSSSVSVDELDLLDEKLSLEVFEWNKVPDHLINAGDASKQLTVLPYVWNFPWNAIHPAWKAAGLSAPLGATYFAGLKDNVGAIVVAILIAGFSVVCAFLSRKLPDGNLNGAGLTLFFMFFIAPLFGVLFAFTLRTSVTTHVRRAIRGTKIEINQETTTRGGYRTIRTTAQEIGLNPQQRLRSMKLAWFCCHLQWWVLHFTLCAALSSFVALSVGALRK